mmetsp:Transcript_39872/g.86060  ORF Transcript_39872/g.86060 Transcript_39872/m.86060 type:complete len:247 (+) Transcript_39872:105-845(+)
MGTTIELLVIYQRLQLLAHLSLLLDGQEGVVSRRKLNGEAAVFLLGLPVPRSREVAARTFGLVVQVRCVGSHQHHAAKLTFLGQSHGCCSATGVTDHDALLQIVNTSCQLLFNEWQPSILASEDRVGHVSQRRLDADLLQLLGQPSIPIAMPNVSSSSVSWNDDHSVQLGFASLRPRRKGRSSDSFSKLLQLFVGAVGAEQQAPRALVHERAKAFLGDAFRGVCTNLGTETLVLFIPNIVQESLIV